MMHSELLTEHIPRCWAKVHISLAFIVPGLQTWTYAAGFQQRASGFLLKKELAYFAKALDNPERY